MNLNNIKEKIINDEIIKSIQHHCKNADVYLVGGAIRDFILDKTNYDKDLIVTNACAKDFAQKLCRELDATFVPLDEENKIYRIVLNDKINYIDIAGIIGENLEDDLQRRDLTINSIAFNLNSSEFLDINNGLKDIQQHKIKHIKLENMLEDPLRMLRVFRFESTLGFSIDEELKAFILKNAALISQIAVERINYELIKLFSGKNCAQSLLSMDETKLLEQIIPFTQDLKKVPPNAHHHLDLFMHSIEVTKQIQKIYEDSTDEIKTHLETIEFGGFDRLTHLKLSGFLHDIGKFSTWTIEEDTLKHRFIKHDDVGSKMASDFLKKNKYSKKQIEYLSKMIKYHIYPSHVVQTEGVNEKNYMRMIRKMDKDFIDIIILAKADRLSARGEEITDEIVHRNISSLNNALNYYLEIRETLKPLPILLDGEEIMKILNIKPSKELGLIVKQLKEAQLACDVTTKEQAIAFITSIRN